MRFNNGAFTTPPVVKNLIIINALFFLAEVILPNGLGDLLIDKLGLYPWQSPWHIPISPKWSSLP